MATMSIIIPTMKGREELLKKLLDSLPDDQYKFQRIVVPDEDLTLAEKRNKGASKARGRFLLFIDDDNYLAPRALEKMMEAHAGNIGIMGMVACYDDKPNVIADGGSKRNYVSGFMKGIHTNLDIREIFTKIYDVDEVANAFMIRRQLFRRLRGFDSMHFPIDLDEADLCKRAKDIGYRIVMNPEAVCYHKSITYSWIPDFRRPMNAYFMGRNRILYQQKHLGKIKYAVYFIFWMPIFVAFYCGALLYRKKPVMIKHFLKGVCDGIFCRK